MFKLKNKKKEVTITLQIPDGYEINENALTFDNIFKKLSIEPIRWVNGDVEINADGEHFLLDASNVTGISNWNNAKRYCENMVFKGEKGQLPTIKQLEVIAKYFDKINKVINEHNGYPLTRGWYWTCEKGNEFYTSAVFVCDGTTLNYSKGSDDIYVRAVCSLCNN